MTRGKLERKFGVVKPWRAARAGLRRVIDPRSVRADKPRSLNACEALAFQSKSTEPPHVGCYSRGLVLDHETPFTFNSSS